MARYDPSQESGFFRRLGDLTRQKENRRGIGRWIRTRLLVGFMVAFPLVVTVFFARFIFITNNSVIIVCHVLFFSLLVNMFLYTKK